MSGRGRGRGFLGGDHNSLRPLARKTLNPESPNVLTPLATHSATSAINVARPVPTTNWSRSVSVNGPRLGGQQRADSAPSRGSNYANQRQSTNHMTHSGHPSFSGRPASVVKKLPESTASSNRENVGFHSIEKLLKQRPEEILNTLLNPKFPLINLLNHSQMEKNNRWARGMTEVLSNMVECPYSNDRISIILTKLEHTKYLEAVYHLVNVCDPITDRPDYGFHHRFLNVCMKCLDVVPSSADCLIKIAERIELLAMKKPSTDDAFRQMKEVLDEVISAFNAIEEKRKRAKAIAQYPNGETTSNKAYEEPPPDDYRELAIIPELHEILQNTKPYLRANIIDGIYDNPRHYLDIHFRLLREDFLGPLRDGLSQYYSGTESKNVNVRIYTEVRFIAPRLSPQSGIIYELMLNPQAAARMNLAISRRLIYGNLLVLISNQKSQYVFVTVNDRSKLEKEFMISVCTLEKTDGFIYGQMDLDSLEFNHSLTMIETVTYFEAYRPILKALKMIEPDQTFPLEEFLLKLNKTPTPPDYVTMETVYDFTPLLVDPDTKASTTTRDTEYPHFGTASRSAEGQFIIRERNPVIRYPRAETVPNKYKRVPVLKSNQWPDSAELHLNPKQRDGLIAALTHKVALLQGPPGTGKTYLGVKIMEMLLYNRRVWCPESSQSTPILMICQTNHALDQFLEMIQKRLNLKEGIVRVGNRCQNQAIARFTLTNARKEARTARIIPGDIYKKKRFILDMKAHAEAQMQSCEQARAKAMKSILSFQELVYLNIISGIHAESLRMGAPDSAADLLLHKWLGIDDSSDNDHDETLANLVAHMSVTSDNGENMKVITEQGVEQQDPTNLLEEDDDEDEQRKHERIETDEDFFVNATSTSTVPETTSHQDTIPTDDQSVDNEKNDGWVTKKKKRKQNQQLIQYIIQHPTTLNMNDVQNINDDLWTLPKNHRYNLYRFWLACYYECFSQWMQTSIQQYKSAINALAEYHQEEDHFLLKDSLIVAMTTTGAANYRSVLQRIQSKIVIVEEAAAMLETHIITSITNDCQHLILIGDHVQLRPNPSVYQLAAQYHIDISLFERLIKNGFPNVRLNIQHRMSPGISYIMKHFYDDLEDHSSTINNRPAIRCVGSSLYLINHSNFETSVADGSSKYNEFEANYVLQLARYLVKQNYDPSQITILTMYLGQRTLIARKAKSMRDLSGMRITVTDNYQGEENDIIILSLVRSNENNRIGFLAIDNRVCVALSRARCGLYVIGNMTMLAGKSEIWKKVARSCDERKNVGRGLPLFCVAHPDDKFDAVTPDCFSKRPEGGCQKPCHARLSCGHACERMCHNYDPKHVEIRCRKACNGQLPCGHLCQKKCHHNEPQNHGLCQIKVDKTIIDCGHPISFPCGSKPTRDDCRKKIEKQLPCSHIELVECRQTTKDGLKKIECPKPCKEKLKCTHSCSGSCGKCQTGRIHVPCQEKCNRPLICGHTCTAPCAENCPPCRKPCSTYCIHSKCKKACGEPCDPCKELCSYTCPHKKCTRLCSEPCDRDVCNEPCEKKLDCGHPCIGFCGEPCPKQCRICNKHVVQEIFFGSEDEPDARFVLLPDCNHIIEATALDKFIADFVNESREQKSIRFPDCPRCKTQIRRCMRYMVIVNRMQNLIEQVKSKIIGFRSKADNEVQLENVKRLYQETMDMLREVDQMQVERYFTVLNLPTTFFTSEKLNLFVNILNYIREIEKILRNSIGINRNVFEDEIQIYVNKLLKYLLSCKMDRNLAQQQIEDINNELARLRRVVSYQLLLPDTRRMRSTGTLNQRQEYAINRIQHLTSKSGPFTTVDKDDVDLLLNELRQFMNLPGLGINEQERVAIVSALRIGQGHWYVCPNGHPYIITECGGANQISICPDCGTQIGGENHRLVETNRHFGLMDNSTHSAWSNEANLLL